MIVEALAETTTQDARKSIWKAFLTAVTCTPKHQVAPFGFRDCDLEELAETRLNGREIKNMLKTAWRRASMIQSQVNNHRVSLGVRPNRLSQDSNQKDVAGCVASYEWLIPGGWGWHSVPLPTSSLPGSSPHPSTVDVAQEQQEVYIERAGSRVSWTEVYPAQTRSQARRHVYYCLDGRLRSNHRPKNPAQYESTPHQEVSPAPPNYQASQTPSSEYLACRPYQQQPSNSQLAAASMAPSTSPSMSLYWQGI